MDGQSFDVNWPVPLVAQPNGMSCWAASAAMVVAWRDSKQVDPAEIATASGEWAAFSAGLNPGDITTLATAWSLEREPPQCYSIDGFTDLLRSKGPLWVAAEVPGLHAIVVTGVYGDGSVDGTFVRLNDPWARDPGTPGAPGAYASTPGAGSQYVLTLTQFMAEYEAAASVDGITVQILHAS